MPLGNDELCGIGKKYKCTVSAFLLKSALHEISI